MPNKTDKLLEEAKKRFKLAEEAWHDNRKAALDDMKFSALDQWPEEAKKARKDRPCLVVDKVNQYIRQVVNDGRQNRPMVKVRPVDDGADIEVAEIYQGIIRHIHDRSNADTAFDTALNHAATCGFGYFRVLTEYEHENTFNQDIVIKRVRNPMAVMLDPNATEADGSDASWGFVVDEISKESFKRQFKNAKNTDWEADFAKYGEGWLDDTNVRIVEYWYKEEQNRTLHLLASGETVDDELYQKAIAEGLQPPAIVQSREIPVSKVKWCRMSGAEVLEEQDWPGKWIPIIPVYGNEYDIDGKVTYSGLVRAAKDPQRLYNYSRSAYAERVALAPKAPYVAAAGQIDEYYDEWSTSNTENYAVLRYDPVDINGTPVPPPQRQQASDIPAGFQADMQLSEHDIQASMGMYNASLGAQSNERSGKAIMARQREGDVATFHYHDNLSRAIRHLGRILVDLIPKIYDSSRVVRILGEDGTPDYAQINPEQDQAVVKIGAKVIYNLNVGVYDVSVSAGPSYTTKRAEAAEAMMQLTQANPAIFQVIGDKMVRAMDWPGADDIADRLKLMLPHQIQQAENKNKEQSPEVQAIMAQAQQAIQEREEVIQQVMAQMKEMQARIAELESQERIKASELAVKERETAIKAFDAETKRLQAISQQMTPEDVQALVLQTVAQLLNSPDVSPPEQQTQQEPPQGGFFMPEESETNPLAGS